MIATLPGHVNLEYINLKYIKREKDIKKECGYWMSVYILCTSTKCRLCTTPVVSLPLLPHNPSPLPSSTRPTSSRWVPPYVPWFCLRFLPDYQGVFSCPCCHCACTKGVSGSGLCKAPRDNCIVMALYK